MHEPKVKIAVRFETSTAGEYEFESLWATPTAEGFRLDNIPFYASSLAFGDVVSAHPVIGGMLEFDSLVRASGHTTVRVWIFDEADVTSVLATFHAMGCSSEVSDLPQLVALDVPPDIPYATVRAVLEEGEKAERFSYQEGCLGQVEPGVG
jgi:hypothetical protein